MINLLSLLAYARHQLTAKTRHGLHSPFVYRLADTVIYNFEPKPDYDQPEQVRAEMLNDDRVITITDLGAGSQINNGKQKKVSQIAKNALKSARLAQLLHRFARDFNPQNILELGTCLGVTTLYLSRAAPQAKVITLEGCPATAALAAENFKRSGAANITQVIGNFDDTLSGILANEEKLDFVFVDGNHRKSATLNYFNQCLPKLTKSSVMIFDDIYWSTGMQEAWNEIKAHPRVTVSIDLFWIGLVFFKEDQAREHFRIKF